MIIQPFGDRVVVKVLEPYQATEGGLLLAMSKEQSNRGIVTGVGEEVEAIKVGDTVVFTSGSGVGYTAKNEDYKILNKRDILGKIVKGE